MNLKEKEMSSKFDVKNLNLYYGEYHALKNVNMEIPEKQITAFIGPSGCGKSTFLKTLNRMNDLVEGCKITGDIKLDGEDIYGNMDVNLLRKRAGGRGGKTGADFIARHKKTLLYIYRQKNCG